MTSFFNLFIDSPQYLQLNKGNIDRVVGHRMRRLRKKKRWTLKFLSEKLDISREMLRRYEFGKNTIKMCILYKLTKIMEVDLDYFFHDIDVKEESANKEYFRIFLVDGQVDDQFLLAQLRYEYDGKISMDNMDGHSMVIHGYLDLNRIPDLIFLVMDEQLRKRSDSLRILKSMRDSTLLQDVPLVIWYKASEDEIDVKDIIIKQYYAEGVNGFIIKDSDNEIFKKKLHQAITYWKDVNWRL